MKPVPEVAPTETGAAPATPAQTEPVNQSKQLTPSAPWQHKPTFWLALLVGVALLMELMLWQKLTGMQEQLARQSASAQAQSLEARALAKQAMELAQESAARSAVQEARLTEVALQRSQLDELLQSLARSRDENLLVDIEAALRLAQQQAQLTGSVEPLLAALNSAAQRIARAAQPRLALLQRAVARDIDRVKSAGVSDTPSMLIRLDELVRLADELVTANAVKQLEPGSKLTGKKRSSPPTWWQPSLDVLLNEVRQLVRVSRIDAPEAVLLTPEQAFFLRENFKLKLLNARLALLARQFDSARSDLAGAEASLKKYFDASSRKTQLALKVLQQVQSQMGNLQLPRIDQTLTTLGSAAAGR